MNTFVAFIRGINVGGHGRLLMKDLRLALESKGLQNVKTYLQSGNAVFQSRVDDRGKLEQEIAGAIKERSSFSPEVFVLSVEDLGAELSACPLRADDHEPKFCISFSGSRPPPNRMSENWNPSDLRGKNSD